jgi:hypothetical protein
MCSGYLWASFFGINVTRHWEPCLQNFLSKICWCLQEQLEILIFWHVLIAWWSPLSYGLCKLKLTQINNFFLLSPENKLGLLLTKISIWKIPGASDDDEACCRLQLTKNILQLTVYVLTESDSSNCFLTTVFMSWKLTTLLKEKLSASWRCSID